jgi:hypothetical protein
MRILGIVWILIGVNSAFAQVFPYEDLYFWSKKDILANKIKYIYGYQFENDTTFVFHDSLCTIEKLQTEEFFDSYGRIIAKTNFYPYTDVGYKKREIGYNNNNEISSYSHFTRTKLDRSEQYIYQSSLLVEWNLMIEEHGFKQHFTKKIDYDLHRRPYLETISTPKKKISKDSIYHFAEENFTAIVRKNAQTKEVVDSVVLYKVSGDTLLKKEIYEKGILVYKETHWQDAKTTTMRIEEYQEGVFHKVYYRRLMEGRVYFEKQIHVVPNLNYDKVYFYNHLGVPTKKEVYVNGDKPVLITYYKTETY